MNEMTTTQLNQNDESTETLREAAGTLDEGTPDDGGRSSQSTQLVALAREAELFHSPDEEAHATVTVGDHEETWPLRSRGFRRWLANRFFAKSRKAPSQQALQNALNVLEGRAVCEGPEHSVFVRVAELGDAMYIDLGGPTWSAVRIDSSGWEVVAQTPVKFRRARGMAALPEPARGGDIAQLRSFINLAHEGDWFLFVGWLIAALKPKGPYPILVLHGEQGSAKSTTARVAKSLVDPSTAPLRSEPRDVRDIMIAARNSWCAVFDNLSHLSAAFSDVLCRLATGGGFATRELYTDSDEVLFDAQRPLLLNGIEELATRGDLLDRSLILNLPAIPEERRRSEREFWAAFSAEQPYIFGALCDALSSAVRNVAATQLSRLPRMADVAQWVTAAEPALGWTPRAFVAAYNGNRELANDVALDWSPVAGSLRQIVGATGAFVGTATELMAKLSQTADEEVKRRRGWPQSPQALSGQLKRIAPNLRAVGIGVEWTRDSGPTRTRLIRLSQLDREGVRAVQTVQGIDDESFEAGGRAEERSPALVSTRPPTPDDADGEDDPMLRAAHDGGLLAPNLPSGDSHLFPPPARARGAADPPFPAPTRARHGSDSTHEEAGQ